MKTRRLRNADGDSLFFTIGLMFGDLSFNKVDRAEGDQFRPMEDAFLGARNTLWSDRFIVLGELQVIEWFNPKLPFSDTFIDTFRFGEGSGRTFW